MENENLIKQTCKELNLTYKQLGGDYRKFRSNDTFSHSKSQILVPFL
ncbi:hypothetical protein CCAL6883_08250 [Campylobacter sp. RM6883]|nr:hypothetical protein [Campylobacter sp. RM6914]MBE2985326.1 hypothetical protein [Campylobacter sp. RM6883]MBE2995859.1 hypothetical protein [Campylobacter sp. RM6913]